MKIQLYLHLHILNMYIYMNCFKVLPMTITPSFKKKKSLLKYKMSSIDYKKYIEHFEKIDRKRKTNQDTSEL